MTKTKSALAAATVAGLLAITGCASAGPAPARSDVLRVDAPVAAAPVADIRSAAVPSAELGLALLSRLSGKGDVAVSPASLEGALALLLPGTRGATADEIRALLGTRLSGDAYAAALGALRRGELTQATQDHNDLSYADDLWLQSGLRLRSPYLRTLAAAFDTGVHTVDFEKDPGGAVAAINAQVLHETRGMIPKLFDQGSLNTSTRLALTDALYLHADWARSFDSDKTTAAPFHLADGQVVQVPTMTGDVDARAGSVQGWQTAELPYRGAHLAMDLLLPAASGQALPTAAQLGAALASVGQGTPATVHLPRFHFSYGQELSGVLQSLGVRTVFGPAADLGGIPADGTSLHVSTVVQRARVDVDEQGTTAAAATGIGVATSAELPPPREISFDRPFLFLIRDTTTGQVLFLGRVTDPR
ncbi:serpin family protein [Streptacidiphilus jiangxiensis]|uniref:Serpin B n=1 Tax=Streptacidiphilus jiangxiensis TaxID=235985 RepID=A0A1H7ZCP5_STRJI|nr:serpin family protein [Streptacidiphilus jiangxiensis]SEM56001.1 serpin B [Streptacidiphilus jiangxiensis]